MTSGRNITKKGSLVAVVVTFNRLEKLKVTVERLLAAPLTQLSHVLVVDNGSSDGTAGWLDGIEDPRLVILHHQENLGGAGGFETGMRKAVADFDPDWMVLMDDDARPSIDALDRFQSIDTSGRDAIAAAVYYPNGDICEMNRPSCNPFWSRSVFFRTLTRGKPGFHISNDAYVGGGQQIDVTSFVGFFLSRKAVDRAGYPDGSLFVYADDSLYTLTLSALGSHIWFSPEIHFEHDCETFQGCQLTPLWKVYYYHRNLLILYRKAAGWWFGFACLVIVPIWLWSAHRQQTERLAYVELTKRAIWDGLRRETKVNNSEIFALADVMRLSGSKSLDSSGRSTPDP